MAIPKYPQIYQSFIQDTISTAKENGIKIRFSKKELVFFDKDDKTGSAGYFSHEPLELAVATKHENPKDWIALMVHESCHMDQYLFNRVQWEKDIVLYEIFFSWLEGTNSYDDHEIKTAVDGVIENELDCERRSVKKIKKYGLPIDLDRYRRRANSYLYAIRFFGIYRKWYNKIYDDDSVWKIAPSNFKSSYEKIPKNLLKMFELYALNN